MQLRTPSIKGDLQFPKRLQQTGRDLPRLIRRARRQREQGQNCATIAFCTVTRRAKRRVIVNTQIIAEPDEVQTRHGTYIEQTSPFVESR